MRGTLLPLLMVGLGIAIVVRTIAAGGGAGAVGILLGVLFMLAGGLRFWFERKAPR